MRDLRPAAPQHLRIHHRRRRREAPHPTRLSRSPARPLSCHDQRSLPPQTRISSSPPVRPIVPRIEEGIVERPVHAEPVRRVDTSSGRRVRAMCYSARRFDADRRANPLISRDSWGQISARNNTAHRCRTPTVTARPSVDRSSMCPSHAPWRSPNTAPIAASAAPAPP